MAEGKRLQLGLRSGAVLVLRAPVSLHGAQVISFEDLQALTAALVEPGAAARFLSGEADEKPRKPYLVAVDAVEYITELPAHTAGSMGFFKPE